MPLTTDQIGSLADAVVLLMGVVPDDQTRDQAKSAVYLVSHFARAYCRGVGFGENEAGEWTVAEPIQGVIVTASARLVSNPTQADSESESGPVFRLGPGGQPMDGPGEGQGPEIGTQSYAHSGGFTGWTEVERAVLHQYRVRNG